MTAEEIGSIVAAHADGSIYGMKLNLEERERFMPTVMTRAVR
jgi:hypothetical protein